MCNSWPKNTQTPQYITIFESELQVISWLTEHWKGKEVGGCLFGLLTRGNRIIIFLALGPGPGAIHRPGFFQQDFEYLTKTIPIVESSYGIQLHGSHHSHQGEHNQPSRPDMNGVISITSRNQAKRWCDIIATNVPSYHQPYSVHRPLLSRNWVNDSSKIKLSAYIYLNPQSGKYFPVKIHVIPGISPLRLHALARGDLDDVTLVGFNTDMSSKKIIYDRLDPELLNSRDTELDFTSLSKQLRNLPPYVQENIKLSNKTNLVIITLPTLTGRTGYIAVDDTAPHKVRAVYMKDSKHAKARDVSDQILACRGDIKLSTVYERLNTIDIQHSTRIDSYNFQTNYRLPKEIHNDSMD